MNEELRLRASKITAKIIAEENRQSRVCSKLRAHVASTKPPVRIPILERFRENVPANALWPLRFALPAALSREGWDIKGHAVMGARVLLHGRLYDNLAIIVAWKAGRENQFKALMVYTGRMITLTAAELSVHLKSSPHSRWLATLVSGKTHAPGAENSPFTIGAKVRCYNEGSFSEENGIIVAFQAGNLNGSHGTIAKSSLPMASASTSEKT